MFLHGNRLEKRPGGKTGPDIIDAKAKRIELALHVGGLKGPFTKENKVGKIPCLRPTNDHWAKSLRMIVWPLTVYVEYTMMRGDISSGSYVYERLEW